MFQSSVIILFDNQSYETMQLKYLKNFLMKKINSENQMKDRKSTVKL